MGTTVTLPAAKDKGSASLEPGPRPRTAPPWYRQRPYHTHTSMSVNPCVSLCLLVLLSFLLPSYARFIPRASRIPGQPFSLRQTITQDSTF